MPKNTKSTNDELFGLLKSRGYSPTPYDSNGKIAPVIEEAEIFQFNFIKDGKDYGPVTITIDGMNQLIVYYGRDVANSPKVAGSLGSEDSSPQKDHVDLSWFQLLKILKKFAKNRQLGFELSDQDNLKYDMAKRNHNKTISEGYYPLGKQKSWNDAIPQVKMIIKHSRAIEEGEQRFRNIDRIFIETVEGERILAPTKKPGLARVFARHIAEGGLPNDEKWNHVKELCEDYQRMSGFVRATKNGIFNESAQQLIQEGTRYLQELKTNLHKMSTRRGYHAYFENWSPVLNEDNLDESSLTEIFRKNILDPRIESAIPVLSKLSKSVVEEDAGMLYELESWADSIVDENLIPSTPEDIERITSILSGDDELVAGPAGQNAINTLDGSLEDDELSEKLKELGDIDPDADAKETVIKWMKTKKEPNLKSISGILSKAKKAAPDQPAAPAPDQADTQPTNPLPENLDAAQKKVNQLGPKDKVGKKGAESRDALEDFKRLIRQIK